MYYETMGAVGGEYERESTQYGGYYESIEGEYGRGSMEKITEVNIFAFVYRLFHEDFFPIIRKKLKHTFLYFTNKKGNNFACKRTTFSTIHCKRKYKCVCASL